MSLPDEPEPSPPPPADAVLPYRPPEGPPEIDYHALGVNAGCFTAGFFVLFGSLLLALVGLKITRWAGRESYAALGFVFALPAAIGVGLLRSRRWVNFGVGLLIGVIVGVLIGALCIWATW